MDDLDSTASRPPHTAHNNSAHHFRKMYYSKYVFTRDLNEIVVGMVTVELSSLDL